MWTEPSLMQAMREAILPYLPSRAFLKCDRGEGLLVTNAPVFNPGLCEIPGFILETQGSVLRILPDKSWLFQLEQCFPEPPDFFSKSLLRFRGTAPNRENLLLFIQGLKLLDAGSTPTPAEISAYDRTLRQRCAEALRGSANGGGLYAAAIILAQINTLYKGEKHT